jgi:hypothetical protein
MHVENDQYVQAYQSARNEEESTNLALAEEVRGIDGIYS